MPEPKTPEGKAKARANLAKGHAMNRARRSTGPTAGERWASLISGQIKFEDLDNEELKRMKVRNADGGFTGKARPLPSHIAQGMRNEWMKRNRAKLSKAVPDAIQALVDMIKDPECSPAVRAKIGQYLLDREFGRAPETVRVVTDNPWGRLESEALDLDADLADLVEGGES